MTNLKNLSKILPTLLIWTTAFAATDTSNNYAITISFDTSVDQLFASLQRSKTQNIDQAIIGLDTKFFKQGNFDLIFDSHSIQSSSNEFPRIVLYGKDNKLMMGFNHRLGNDKKLEVIQLRAPNEWEFREISFNSRGPQISKPNPKQCLQCHGEPNARPNSRRFMTDFLNRNFPGVTNLRAFQKEKYWLDFLKNAPRDSIYSRLDLSANK